MRNFNWENATSLVLRENWHFRHHMYSTVQFGEHFQEFGFDEFKMGIDKLKVLYATHFPLRMQQQVRCNQKCVYWIEFEWVQFWFLNFHHNIQVGAICFFFKFITYIYAHSLYNMVYNNNATSDKVEDERTAAK